ncbi:MAG TPA: hypothetical protein VF930_01575, partial [Stellaceae bacterium]
MERLAHWYKFGLTSDQPAAFGRIAMKPCPSSYHALLLAGIAGLSLYAGPLAAQQPSNSTAPAAQSAPAPLPAPTTNSALKDAPKSEAAAKLAPVAALPIPTAAD